MKGPFLTFGLLLGWASSAWAAPAPLTTLRSIVSLSNAEAAQKLPAVFEATVTYYAKPVNTLFVQDDGAGLYVFPNTESPLLPGDRILVRGKTEASFHPIVIPGAITVLRHGDLPKPVPATYGELIRVERDCLLVTVRGIVRAIDKDETDTRHNGNSSYMQVLVDGGYIAVYAEGFTAEQRKEALDAEVEVTGVAGGVFDGKMQMHGIALSVPSPAFIKILKRASASPWSLPLTPMDQVITSFYVADRSQRVRVHGTITYNEPGSSVVLQDGRRSLWIATLTRDPLQIGDVADATGFPEAHKGFLALTRGEILDSHTQAPVAPFATTRKELARNEHVVDLVAVEGQVVSEARGATQDEYGLTADGQLFSAVYRHPSGESVALPPMKRIPIGSSVRVTGICITEDSNPFAGEVPFDILMRSPGDIVVVVRPSLINTRNLLIVVSVLFLVVIAVGFWGWTLRRKVRSQTADLAKRIEAEAVLERRSAQLERQRSRILEDINGARPLADIVEQIVEMVSFGLKGARCWCETGDTAIAGTRPAEGDGLRILREKIVAHSGQALGAIYAGLDPLAPADDNEREAVSVGARLTALAIETRRLFSDLRRRSEFDLLTEIHNRFSMDKYLDALIEEAQHNGGLFGLIYIDLDRFKPVNDRYGHHAGDLYLQAVAERMKSQLRGRDMLARLGGDEFAALVTMVRSRADVEEIAQRLERCFDAPFIVEGYTLRGAASFGIALYPEDSATKDTLLSAADTAMYEAKNRKRQLEAEIAHRLHPELAGGDR